MSELKPCPFCGNKNPRIVHHFVNGIANLSHCFVRCNCGRGKTTASRKEEHGAIDEWNTRPIEDELRAELEKRTAGMHDANAACMEMKHELDRLKNQVTDYLAVNAELVEKVESRDEKIAELEAIVNPASFRKFLVEQIKDHELAEAYVKACIQDTTYKELLARRDEIIARLKEDAERLADIADMFGDDAIAVLKHRALMKELE